LDVDNYILARLSDGAKSFTELAEAIIPRICARGTLSKHLKSLEKDGRIKRELFEDRRTKYILVPEYASSARAAMDIVTLESLIDELECKTRQELNLQKTQPRKDPSTWIQDLYDRIAGLTNKPNINFMLNLDKDTLKIVNLVESTSKLASELQNLVRGKLEEMKMKMPSTIKSERSFLRDAPRSWSELKEFSRRTALKHGLRFLVVSWYDGKEYKQKIASALESIKRLEKDHREEIDFLDEVNKRCYYSNSEYYYEPEAVLEEVSKGILEISSPELLLENAFWLYFWKEQEVMWLEAALISPTASNKISKDKFRNQLWKGSDKIPSPYDIVRLDVYTRMKLYFFKENEKIRLVQYLLESFAKYIEGEGQLLISDIRNHSQDYLLATTLLLEKLDTETKTGRIEIKSPIMNLKFYDAKRKIDFSDEPFAKNFLAFKKDPKRRKWLQKCLLVGLPIFPYIPFDKLGFEVKNIL